MGALFPNAKELFANGKIDWCGDEIEARLVSNGVTVAAQMLSGKTNYGGACGAAPLVFRAVVGPPIGELVICHVKTGVDILSNDMGGLTPIGTDVKIEWNEAGIFSL